MNENEVRTRLRDAMGDSEYPPELPGRVLARLNQPPAPGHPRMLAVVAGVLAALIVVGLVYVRVNSTNTPRPAATPSPTPAVQIPQSILDATHLTVAAPLIVAPNLSTTIRQRSVSLVGAYADALETVLIFRALLATTSLGISLWDESGLMEPFGPMTIAADGYQYAGAGAPYSGADSVAHISVSIADPYDPALLEASPARRDFGGWNFSFNLPVRPATTLPVQRLITLGTWRVTVESFELTPTVIYLDAVINGPTTRDKSSSAIQALSLAISGMAVLIDPSGNAVDQFGGGTDINLEYSRAQWWWPRPDHATTYTLRIAANGGLYTTTVSIPPPLQS